GDDFGRDAITDLGGLRDYDFSPMTEGTTTTVDAGRMIVQPSGYNRRIIGYGTINGVQVPLIPDKPSEVMVLMPGHSFQVGDKVTLDVPDFPEYSKKFTVASVTANTFNFIDNNFSIIHPRGVPVLFDLGEAFNHQLVDALVFHDGVNKAYVKFDVPSWFPVNGLRMEGSAKAYTGTFPLTLVREGWYSFAVSYDDVREELDTTVLPNRMEFGSGDDKITFNGAESQTILLTDSTGGFDTLQIKDSLAPTFTLVAGRAINNSLDVTYSGFDQLNLLDPTVSLTLQSSPPGSSVDLGAVGLGIVAQGVVLPFDLTATSFEVNSRDSFVLNHDVDVESLNLRVFGDNQGITVAAPLTTRLPLTAADSIQLFAPDGDISLPAGVQLTTTIASIKAKTLSVPQNK
ncbi:MAG TPA: hypothetical protein PLV92_27075, partial [Pirellulaceae bacterium]|nr:hypothetical protein [Pirellulaceae bacterium]